MAVYHFLQFARVAAGEHPGKRNAIGSRKLEYFLVPEEEVPVIQIERRVGVITQGVHTGLEEHEIRS